MPQYTIHPIVVGTKVFDKGMMTYQHDYGQRYVIPIYAWFIEGGSKDDPRGHGGDVPSAVCGSGSRDRREDSHVRLGLGLAGGYARKTSTSYCTPTYTTTIAKTTPDAPKRGSTSTRGSSYASTIHIHSTTAIWKTSSRIQKRPSSSRCLQGTRRSCRASKWCTRQYTPKGACRSSSTQRKAKRSSTGFCVHRGELLPPEASSSARLGSHTTRHGPVNVYDSYDIMLRVKEMADILIPLHEPRFAKNDTVTR